MITAPAPLLTAGLLGALLLSGPSWAQESPEELTPLDRATRTFAAADLDRDGLIELDELKQASISTSVLKTWDEDGSSSLSKDEFLGYYRRLMVNAGLPPGEELNAEVKRIEAEQTTRKERAARQRAQEEQEAKQKEGEPAAESTRPASTGTSAGGESTLEKYKRAQAALNQRLAAARASREVASEQQQALLERARGASAGSQPTTNAGGASETARERLARAQAALDGRARGSNATREQLARAKARLEDRANRKVGAAGSAGAGGEQAAPAAPGAQLRSKLERASDQLAERAASGDMTREQQQALQAALEERARQAGSGGVVSPQPVVAEQATGAELGEAASRAQELEGVPATDRDKVSRAIDALEARAKKGGWSREKLAAEKADLLARARAAQPAGAAAETSPGSETPEQRKAREARKRAAEQQGQPAGETPEQRKAREARKRAAEQQGQPAGETPEQRKAREARKRAAEQQGQPAGETPEQRKAREARKRAAEQQGQPAGETPEQRKAREARKRAADAQRSSSTSSGRPKSGSTAKSDEVKASTQGRPSPTDAGRSRGGGR
jgi:hypothetical protein